MCGYDVRHDRQAESGSGDALRVCRGNPVKSLEDLPVFRGIDADAVIGDPNGYACFITGGGQLDSTRRTGKLHRVVQQVQQSLDQGVPVRPDLRKPFFQCDRESKALLFI